MLWPDMSGRLKIVLFQRVYQEINLKLRLENKSRARLGLLISLSEYVAEHLFPIIKTFIIQTIYLRKSHSFRATFDNVSPSLSYFGLCNGLPTSPYLAELVFVVRAQSSPNREMLP